jgi:hypothetical protein
MAFSIVALRIITLNIVRLGQVFGNNDIQQDDTQHNATKHSTTLYACTGMLPTNEGVLQVKAGLAPVRYFLAGFHDIWPIVSRSIATLTKSRGANKF